MATTIPRSVYSTRRNSLHRDDHADPGGHSRRPSNINHQDGKIAVEDDSVLAASQDADSMKYPVPRPQPADRTGDYNEVGFGDFGKSLIDEDYLKGFGLIGGPSKNSSPNSKATSRLPSRGHSRGNSQAHDPFVSAPGHSVYELDVPHMGYAMYSSPERGGSRPADGSSQGRNTPKQSVEMTRLRTPEAGPMHGMRKGSAPVIKASPDSPPVKVKRLSGFSLKSVKSAFSRNDYPEVVQPPSPTGQPRSHESNSNYHHQHHHQQQPSRVVNTTYTLSGPGYSQYDYGSSAPPPAVNSSSQFAPRQPRAMASTPHLNQQVPPSPAVPRPWMTRRPSASSLRSTMSNINKPLPPEPGQRPVDQFHPSRTPTTPRAPLGASRTPNTSSPSRPLQDVPASPAPHQMMKSARRVNTAPSHAAQLRSKYTPKDLDALDDAFQRSNPAPPNSAGIYGATFLSPALGDSLDPIRESPQGSQQHLDIHAPLQIARGPMRMEPSRRPPPTPGSRSRSPVSLGRSGPSTPEPPTQLPQRNHVATQSMHNSRRPSDARLDSSAMHLGGGSAKVQQILGEGSKATEQPTEADRIAERQPAPVQGRHEEGDGTIAPVQPSSVPHAQEILFGSAAMPPAQSLGPTDEAMVRSESFSSHQGAFRTGTTDVHFNEIRRRLELLSPTTATDTSFMSTQIFGQMLSNQVNAGEVDPVESGQPQQQQQPQPQPQQQPQEQQQVESRDIREPLHNEPQTFVEELPGDTVRIQSMAPVELPTEANWANTLAGLYEMAGSASPRVSIQPATPAGLASFVPPPVPESPKRESRRHHSHTQSMLSSGSGRTKSIRSIKSARSARSAKARSITSAAASEIPELYAGLPSPRTTLASRRASTTADFDDIPEMPPMPEIMTTEELEEMDVISADTAEQVLYQILRNLLDPRDLFSASLVSRGFQRTFTHHDTKLLRNALWYSSPPAWEYLEMHMPISSETGQLTYPPKVYRQQWIHSMACLTKIKAMILHHCGRSLSPITALMLDAKDSKHSAPVDDAIWRIWTFCKIFGEDEDRREDLELQKLWIKGQTIVEAHARSDEPRSINPQDYPAFGFGNDEGLSPEELMRMGEIWLCLRVLVRGYRGQRREAREFGIFEGADIPRGDSIRENALLDEWTIHLLSLAPGTNLQVLCPQTATQENFITAESLGFTSWTPPGRNFTSSGFLTGPICSVLEEWLTKGVRQSLEASQDEVHPAFRDQNQVFPSRQQVGLFVDRLRTVKDVLVNPGPQRKKSIPGSVDGNNAAPLAAAPVILTKSFAPEGGNATPAPSKSAKETSKKSSFANFGSKLSLRLPSRSLTSANKNKLQAPPVPAQRALSHDSTAEGNPPSPTESLKSSRFFSRSKSTTNKGGATRIFLRNPSRKNVEAKVSSRNMNLQLAVNGASEAPSREGSRGNHGPDERTRPGSYIESYDKLPVYPDTPGVAAGADSTNPHILARNQLINQGFEPSQVDAVLGECTTPGGIELDKALKRLKRSKRQAERIQRLDRMG